MAATTVPSARSLVKYDTAISISSTKGKNGTKTVGAGAPAAQKEMSPTEDILNSILPPREWTEDAQLWVQYVSSTPATRLDIENLQAQLDRQLQERQARETGICPIREELYAQCFDELIRQVTINCAERGLLLLRVRDEIRTSLASYQILYESSIAYGMRKALYAAHQKAEFEEEASQCTIEIRDLDTQVNDYHRRNQEFAENEDRSAAEAEASHKTEVESLRNSVDELKAQLEEVLSVPRKK